MKRTACGWGALLLGLGAITALGAPFGCGGGGTSGDWPVDENGEAGASGTGNGTSNVSAGFGHACRSDRDCRAYSLLCGGAGCVECVEVEDCPVPSEGEAVCDMGRCENVTPCVNSLDCSESQVCDRNAGVCVECVQDADCDDGHECIGRHCAVVQSCRNSLDCEEHLVCDRSANLCVQCVGDNDCEMGEQCLSQGCVPETSCTASDGCDDALVCDLEVGRCVECVAHGDCGEGEVCEERACRPSATDCEPARVALLIQRSGAMFETPAVANSWWNAVRGALSGSQGLVARYRDKVDLRVSFFYREEGTASCPLSHEAVSPTPADIEALLDEAEAAHMGTMEKVDAPIPEAVEAAAQGLAGFGADSAIILVTTGVPDTCEVLDDFCSVDPVIASVQAAWASGVATYPIGLESFSFGDMPYYLQAVANAGAGQPVNDAPAQFDLCPKAADYSATGGGTDYVFADEPGELAGHIEALLEQFAAACDG